MKPRLLIVDDQCFASEEGRFRLLEDKVLKKYYDVSYATNEEEMYAVLKSTPIACILLDIYWDYDDKRDEPLGMAILERLRQRDNPFRDMPVLMLTRELNTEGDFRKRCFDLAAHYIDKGTADQVAAIPNPFLTAISSAIHYRDFQTEVLLPNQLKGAVENAVGTLTLDTPTILDWERDFQSDWRQNPPSLLNLIFGTRQSNRPVYDDAIIHVSSGNQSVQAKISKGVLFPDNPQKDIQARSVLIFACYQAVVAPLRPNNLYLEDETQAARERYGYVVGLCNSSSLLYYFKNEASDITLASGERSFSRGNTESYYRRLISDNGIYEALRRMRIRSWFDSEGGKRKEYRIYGNVQFKWGP